MDGFQFRRFPKIPHGQVDIPGGKKTQHTRHARFAIDIALIGSLEVEGQNGVPVCAACRARNSSNSRFQARAWTEAVRVMTPSRSKMKAANRPRSMTNIARRYRSPLRLHAEDDHRAYARADDAPHCSRAVRFKRTAPAQNDEVAIVLPREVDDS